MIDIQVQNIIKSFDLEKNVLDGVSFTIQQGEKVGLLGGNGTGKTTLLKIITKEYEATKGEVMVAPGKKIGLISQIPVYPEEYTVRDVLLSAFTEVFQIGEEMKSLENSLAAGDSLALKRYGTLQEKYELLGGYELETKVNKVVNGLSIPKAQLNQHFNLLSGGEKTRANLGRMILEDTEILLLDEPTNHLDLHATQWLEDYVNSFKGTVLIISHDRYFLDKTISRAIELIDGKAEFYSGNYSFYAIEKERRYLEKLKQYEKEQAKISQLEKSAEQLRVWAFMGMDKTFRRAKSMEKRIERMRTTEKPYKSKSLKEQFHSKDFKGDEVFVLKGLQKQYGEKMLFHDVNLLIEPGDRIALLGDNGSGKTTLLKILLGQEAPDLGGAKKGPSIDIAYLPQIVEFQNPGDNVLGVMMSEGKCVSQQSARNRLAAFDFAGEDVEKSLTSLSGGERSRLKLSMIMSDKVNMLILDEPTNHLDIESREWMEDAVENFDGTLLFVSHDRYFINRFANRIWELKDGLLVDYPMNYRAYELEKKEAPVTEPSRVEKKSPIPMKNSQSTKRKLEICEREIGKAESQIAALEQQIEENAFDAAKLEELFAQKQDIENKLNAYMEQWEELSLLQL